MEEVLRINRRLEIKRLGEEKGYSTVIQEVGKGDFAVHALTLGGVFLRLNYEEEVGVTVYGEETRYRFTTWYLGTRKDNILLYVFARPISVERVQMRNFVRVETALEVRYRLLSPLEENLGEDSAAAGPAEDTAREATTVDISGGGMQILAREELPSETMIEVEVSLPFKGKPVSLLVPCRVKRCQQISLKRFRIGLVFDGLEERIRDEIIRYIFQRMREQWKLR